MVPFSFFARRAAVPLIVLSLPFAAVAAPFARQRGLATAEPDGRLADRVEVQGDDRRRARRVRARHPCRREEASQRLEGDVAGTGGERHALTVTYAARPGRDARQRGTNDRIASTATHA